MSVVGDGGGAVAGDARRDQSGACDSQQTAGEAHHPDHSGCANLGRCVLWKKLISTVNTPKYLVYCSVSCRRHRRNYCIPDAGLPCLVWLLYVLHLRVSATRYPISGNVRKGQGKRVCDVAYKNVAVGNLSCLISIQREFGRGVGNHMDTEPPGGRFDFLFQIWIGSDRIYSLSLSFLGLCSRER